MSDQPVREHPVVGSQTDSRAIPSPEEDDEFTIRYLEPDKTRVTRSPMGSARLELADEVCYPRIVVRRLFPLSDPDKYYSLWLGDDREIGILRDPKAFDEETQRVLAEELEKRYFTPVIRRIHKVKERFGVHDWFVETSHGELTFSVRGLHDNLKQVPPNRIIVTDVRGNRYDIPNVAALDPHSIAQIQRHL
jgi:hypothetical protein